MLATRYLATDSPEHREELLGALQASPDAPEEVAWWATGRSVTEADLLSATDRLLDANPDGAGVCRILVALARLEREPRDNDELQAVFIAASALQDGYAVLYMLATHRETWERDRNGRAALLDEADWWLAALEGDRPALRLLEQRLAATL